MQEVILGGAYVVVSEKEPKARGGEGRALSQHATRIALVLSF